MLIFQLSSNFQEGVTTVTLTNILKLKNNINTLGTLAG